MPGSTTDRRGPAAAAPLLRLSKTSAAAMNPSRRFDVLIATDLSRCGRERPVTQRRYLFSP